MKRAITAICLAVVMLLAGCVSKDSEPSEIDVSDLIISIDITNAIFSNNNASCAAYVGNYFATPTDMSHDEKLAAYTNITSDDQACQIHSNGVPNHNLSLIHI